MVPPCAAGQAGGQAKAPFIVAPAGFPLSRGLACRWGEPPGWWCCGCTACRNLRRRTRQKEAGREKKEEIKVSPPPARPAFRTEVPSPAGVAPCPCSRRGIRRASRAARAGALRPMNAPSRQRLLASRVNCSGSGRTSAGRASWHRSRLLQASRGAAACARTAPLSPHAMPALAAYLAPWHRQLPLNRQFVHSAEACSLDGFGHPRPLAVRLPHLGVIDAHGPAWKHGSNSLG